MSGNNRFATCMFRIKVLTGSIGEGFYFRIHNQNQENTVPLDKEGRLLPPSEVFISLGKLHFFECA